MCLTTPAMAIQPPEPVPLQVRVISNDRGGSVAQRVHEVRFLRRTGQPVQITGRVCLSSCTMLLSLAGTCIFPETIFGFHGPSRHGRPLKPETFDAVSKLIAAHYPAAVRQWYMAVARHRIDGHYEVPGYDLIAAGVRAC